MKYVIRVGNAVMKPITEPPTYNFWKVIAQ